MAGKPFVVAVKRPTREALLSDNTIVPITNLVDVDGEDTDDIHEAVAFVAGSDGVGWFSGDLDDFPPGFIQ